MQKNIEKTYEQYQSEKDNITRGIISNEHIQLVTEGLKLKDLSNEELTLMWDEVYRFFNEKLTVKDEDGKTDVMRPFSSETKFLMDAKSAWLEVVNVEARRRKELGLL